MHEANQYQRPCNAPRQVFEKELKQKVAFFFLQNMGWGNWNKFGIQSW